MISTDFLFFHCFLFFLVIFLCFCFFLGTILFFVWFLVYLLVFWSNNTQGTTGPRMIREFLVLTM